MLLQCRFIAPVCRQDLNDYVREIEIDVLSYDEEVFDTYLVGRLTLNRILWMQAIVDGASLYEVCDDDSQGLHDIFIILTDGKTGFREDLLVEDVAQEVLFVHRILLHPDVQPFRLGILDAALTLFSEDSLAVMWREEGELTESELAQLGFAKIAETNLIFRRSWYRSKFSDEHPRGQDCEMDARPDHEEWVKSEWRKRLGPEGDLVDE